VVKRDPQFDEQGARRAMLDVFEVLGRDHPLVERFRAELAARSSFEGVPAPSPPNRVRGGAPVVQLFGRAVDGPAFLVEDDRFRPYFFLRADAAASLAGEPAVRVEPSELRDLGGAPVVRVECALPGDLPPLRERLAARARAPSRRTSASRTAT